MRIVAMWHDQTKAMSDKYSEYGYYLKNGNNIKINPLS